MSSLHTIFAGGHDSSQQNKERKKDIFVDLEAGSPQRDEVNMNDSIPLVPQCQFTNVAQVETDAGMRTPMHTPGRERKSNPKIANALANAHAAASPRSNLNYHVQDGHQNWRVSTPQRSQQGTPRDGGAPRDVNPANTPPRVSPFANMPIRKDDSEGSDSPIMTPTVTPHGTPRSDTTNKVFSAARHGKHKVVEDCLLMEEGYFDPLNTTDHHGNTLFHVACQNGNKKIAKLAIKYGGDMNKPNNKGNTGLHFLYQFGYEEIAEYFVSKGADNQIQNNKGYACTQGFKGDIVPS